MELQSPQADKGSEIPRVLTVRRNPPRKAKLTPVPGLFTSSAVDQHITPIPIDGILQPEPDLISPSLSKPSCPNTGASENLRVFLRIRPLETKARASRNPTGGSSRARGKGTSPKLEEKSRGKNKNAVCLVANDSRSVTLAVPPSRADFKRVKSEVYDGFSFVFPQESHQKEVYERVMKPLVMDFIEGKSGLLAAMGPTGSGKTHTMFGCPREPGLVPLALRQIFCPNNTSDDPYPLRSYYFSMFEIYSERGKGERIFDLSRDGADLYIQQSTIKGLQEIMVSDLAEAECLVARGMLKRATAATSANNQSSRSQCVINIRCVTKSNHDENEFPRSAVMTIVDLAGAEREKRTGNKGVRLLESNFINNTSMVFGLCLRSLLEHQKNTKRPFQKHFQNSLLTRFLRDFLEGKKRMSLILTVKPGEDDYLDTSFLLRQASPYMKIKFNNEKELAVGQKRCTVPLAGSEHSKRRKYYEVSVVDATKSIRGGNSISKKGQYQPQILALSPKPVRRVCGEQLFNEHYTQLQRLKRSDQVMRYFSKALWNVLKQYKRQLEMSESEVHRLKESLIDKESRYVELEKELKDLKLQCLCHNHPLAKASCSPQGVIGFKLCATGSPSFPANAEVQTFEILNPSILVEDLKDQEPIKPKDQNWEGFLRNPGSEEISSHANLTETGGRCLDSLVRSSQSRMSVGYDKCTFPSPVERRSLMQDEKVDASENMELSLFTDRENYQHECEELKGPKDLAVKGISANTNLTVTHLDPLLNSAQSLLETEDGENMLASLQKQGTLHMEEEKVSEAETSFVIKDLRHNEGCHLRELQTKEKKQHECTSQPLNAQRPSRRLLPVTAMLLKEFGSLNMEDENSKVSRDEEKATAAGRRISPGSMSLVRLLRSNIHHHHHR